MPFEEVRDFFYDSHNHIAQLDDAAEQLFVEGGLRIGSLDTQLTHCSNPNMTSSSACAPIRRTGRAETRLRRDQSHPHAVAAALAGAACLPDRHSAGVSHAVGGDRATARGGNRPEVRMPGNWRRSAWRTTSRGRCCCRTPSSSTPPSTCTTTSRCSRCSSRWASRPSATGSRRCSAPIGAGCRSSSSVPTEPGTSRAQSATAFHFSRVGGSCPLWWVHDAFGTPGRIVTQVAQMPDGRTYLWTARTTDDGARPYGTPDRSFAVGLAAT